MGSLNRQLASDPKSNTIKKCAQPDYNVNPQTALLYRYFLNWLFIWGISISTSILFFSCNTPSRTSNLQTFRFHEITNQWWALIVLTVTYGVYNAKILRKYLRNNNLSILKWNLVSFFRFCAEITKKGKNRIGNQILTCI